MATNLKITCQGEEADVRFVISLCKVLLKKRPEDADAQKLLASSEARLAQMLKKPKKEPEPALKHWHD